MLVIPEIQAKSVVKQQTIKSTLYVIELDSVPSYTSNDTKRNDTLCAVLSWAIIIKEPFRSGAE